MQIELPPIDGIKLFCSNGSSYNCPLLNLYGFSSERSLRNAVKREMNKRKGK